MFLFEAFKRVFLKCMNECMRDRFDRTWLGCQGSCPWSVLSVASLPPLPFACLKWNWAHERGNTNRLQSTGCLFLRAWLPFERFAGTLIQGDLQWLIRLGVRCFALGRCHGTQGYLWRFWEHACNVSVLGRPNLHGNLSLCCLYRDAANYGAFFRLLW